jgi:predicted CoA-substrate-specific enzyme activase
MLDMKSDEAECGRASNPVFAGLEIGTVSVKWVQRTGSQVFPEIILHGGDPLAVVRRLLDRQELKENARIVVTGQSAKTLLDFPYRAETECMEKAISHLGLDPDMLLSLGGETFSVYPMKDGKIKNIIATSKCAAGTGEFIVQQFQRMGMSLKEGIEAGRKGNVVALATRCSVHCKSDATHKLNKGECLPGDIAQSLIHDLAEKVGEMVEKAQWPSRLVLISGGLSLNDLFIEHLRRCLDHSELLVLEQSPCLEAFGASLFAMELPETRKSIPAFKASAAEFEHLPSLGDAGPLLDWRVRQTDNSIIPNGSYLLGVDAGSTTTKAVLLNHDDLSIGASCYLRTLGNPIVAVKNCLEALIRQVGEKPITLKMAAVTGSAREMVSVYLDNCLSFNEILAHARAAAMEAPEVDTVFEIGGQDSKYISFQNGVPVDYAMNEGCSAGTGSFLEESASVDMEIAVKEISRIAESSTKPLSFGERCAAFINTDVRNALQQGALRQDVIAGLVYSIADNYISRIVGPRHVGKNLLFLGGVALNRSVGLALAARAGQKIIVPANPELMGCVGAALKARDLLAGGSETGHPCRLGDLVSGEMAIKETFRCKSCGNNCEIQKIAIREKTYPFGGLCSKYEKKRHGKSGKEGRDLISLRNQIMFEEFNPETPATSRGAIGLPMALTSFELFPFYAKLIHELGYRVVLSNPSKTGNARTLAPICYPCELVHGAAYDLMQQKADYIFVPHVVKIDDADDAFLNYTCPSTTVIPDIIRSAFGELSGRILSPHIGLSQSLLKTTLEEIEKMGAVLGLKKNHARQAGEKALAHYENFKQAYRKRIKNELDAISIEPAVVIAGRPYVVCSPGVNLALPRKIASRGYHVLSIDMLPPLSNTSHPRDVWHFTRQIENAVAHVQRKSNLHICLVSCFSCGPDASMFHHIRQELSNRTFCYLEIDSHTAHAGFETRVGAFIDIIEETRQRGK